MQIERLMEPDECFTAGDLDEVRLACLRDGVTYESYKLSHRGEGAELLYVPDQGRGGAATNGKRAVWYDANSLKALLVGVAAGMDS